MDCRTKQHWTCVVLMFMFSWTENALTDKASDCSCYKFNIVMKNWDNSNKDCRSNGGSLVSMETESEWKFINEKIQNIYVSHRAGDNEWYIGLTNRTGKWRWNNGQSMTTLINNKWQNNQPSGDGKYVVMAKNYPPGSQGLFNDVQGSTNQPYICEYKDASYCRECNYRNTQGTSTTGKPVTSKSTTISNSFIYLFSFVCLLMICQTVHFFISLVQRSTKLAVPNTNNKHIADPTSKHPTSKKPQYVPNYSTPRATDYPTSRISTSKTSFQKRTTPNVSHTTLFTTIETPTQKQSAEQQSPKDSFPLVSIVIVIGVLFVVFMCLVIATCYWRTRKKVKRHSAAIPNEIPDTSQQDDKKQNRVDIPTAAAITNITEVIEDSSFVAFTMVHNNLTQTKPPKTEDPVYASISTGNNGVSMETPLTTNSDETQAKQGVVYASVDKTKKMNTKKNKAGFVGSRRMSKERFAMNEVSQTVSPEAKEVVYASVDKSAKNRDKQQQPQITYADLAEFKNNASGVLQPTPYQPVEYAVIIGKSNSN